MIQLIISFYIAAAISTVLMYVLTGKWGVVITAALARYPGGVTWSSFILGVLMNWVVIGSLWPLTIFFILKSENIA